VDEFSSELMIHFPGLEHLQNPGVLILPRMMVCLNCGFSQFKIRESETALLASGSRKKRALWKKGRNAAA
jgi:hypothetical protein